MATSLTLIAAIALSLVLVLRSRILRPAKYQPLRQRSGPVRRTEPRLERYARIAAEVNAYLLIAAIGLAALDVGLFAILDLPSPAQVMAMSVAQERVFEAKAQAQAEAAP